MSLGQSEAMRKFIARRERRNNFFKKFGYWGDDDRLEDEAGDIARHRAAVKRAQQSARADRSAQGRARALTNRNRARQIKAKRISQLVAERRRAAVRRAAVIKEFRELSVDEDMISAYLRKPELKLVYWGPDIQ